ncbi:hypothetical protein BC643_2501 [Mangrovibacterium diazotrophicum]|uniref:Tetratricopeptide repeat protein n=2 Tax=Mangrovibacterium diazotrophicum TaxID=1261403 RepID=A0A419W9I2_9BACT|nr:hypothetical protein BC643_2501 [Mangrovibacterium diazotrophicum]
MTLLLLSAVVWVACNQAKKNKQQLSYTTVTCAVPATTDQDWYSSGKKAPLFDNLGNYSYPITTSNELVQRYFDQGLVLAYGFNHAEAARSFYYATQLDPNCAMAYCGYAYVLGPNYNAGMEPDHYQRAYKAIQKAVALSDQASPKEKALIAAMAKRYAPEPPESRQLLDEAYSAALKELWGSYPDDPYIGTLYAESLLNLHPWDLYETDGSVKAWTPEIIETLNQVIALNPKHPGANHFYIHAVEASPTPQLGYESARLYDEGLVPGAGHLVHMPSHIYIRTGDYHKGTLANINAVDVDSAYTTACHAQGVYPLAYYPHNYHFLAATATLEGNAGWGVRAAEKMAKDVSIQLMKEPGWGTLQHYYTIPDYVYVKFGLWDKILELKNEVPDLTYPSAIRAYARGMAFAGKGDLKAAKDELAQLEHYATDESLKELTVWEINSTYDLVNIAEKVLKAEILASEQQYDESIQLLTEAVAIEDGLNYNEPPDWFFSVRHHLGAVQIEAKHYNDAIETYTQDLKNLPKNGWALHGMKLAYNNLGETDKAEAVDQQLAEVWATADTRISSSRIK